MPTKKLLPRLLLLGVLLIQALPRIASPVQAKISPAQTVTPPVLPPECRARSPFKPRSTRWWAFVLNFNVPLTGCVLLFNNTPDEQVVAYKSLPTCIPSGEVAFRDGRAIFNGGSVACSVNLYQTINALAGREVITQTGDYDFFYMLGRGIISPTRPLSLTSLAGANPIITYRPANTESLNIGLATPVIQLDPNIAGVVSRFNRVNLFKENCRFAFTRELVQTWAFTQVDQTVTHWANGREMCQFERPLPLRLWHDGGQFVIGGTPFGTDFYGVIEEVIVDPAGTNKPPSGSEGDWQVFIPLVLRTD
jgi:hypothetical protein